MWVSGNWNFLRLLKKYSLCCAFLVISVVQDMPLLACYLIPVFCLIILLADYCGIISVLYIGGVVVEGDSGVFSEYRLGSFSQSTSW